MSDTTRSAPSISISTLTIVKVAVALLVLYGVYLITDILMLVVASAFLASALTPTVDWLETKHRFPRSVSMIGIYVLMLGVLTIITILIAPLLVTEMQTISQELPRYYEQANAWLSNFSHQIGGPSNVLSLPANGNTLSSLTSNVFSAAGAVVNSMASIVVVLFLGYYLAVDSEAIKRLVIMAPAKHRTRLTTLITRVQRKIGMWLRAQLLLMLIIAVMSYVFLLIIGMPSALLLALIAGLAEAIPYLGPIIGAVPAIFLAYAISPQLAIVVAIGYYCIQMVENNILVPKIMQRALGLSPIISIVVFLVGARLAGIVGAILAIPFATAAMVILKDVMSHRNTESTEYGHD